ncbi:hypothetical protein F5I97DRAFT_1817656 [Phlebopus sp. FC_14]|nr:hypothetical protein F5I97DRAFT_1817656 [Phlebopus sp. FC_14]
MSFPSASAELHGSPSVGKRLSIARPPSSPYEDCDVLVLSSRSTLPDPTSVGNILLYLDLRVTLPVSPASSIDWAFSGLRYTLAPPESQQGAVRYRWEHSIDSHGTGEPLDEGTMVKRTGDDGQEVEVETGVGLNPETGEMGPYEEVWKEIGLPPNSPFVFLMSDPNPSSSTRFMAIVGEHGLALSQDGGRSAASCPKTFHATRVRRAQEKMPSDSYETLYTTGYRSLEQQIGRLWSAAARRIKEKKEMWRRGESVVFTEDKPNENSEDEWSWTVWDAGYVCPEHRAAGST